jgi:hypothetical protein
MGVERTPKRNENEKEKFYMVEYASADAGRMQQ